MAGPKKDPQIGLEDHMVEDAALLALLEHRQKAKEAEARATATFTGWHEKTTAKLESLDLGDGVHRCGPYVITLGRTKAHTVEEFSTKGGERTTKIRPVKEPE